MVEVDKINRQSANNRKKYRSPRVVDFGRVRELTTGGSGNPSEMGLGDNHPNKMP